MERSEDIQERNAVVKEERENEIVRDERMREGGTEGWRNKP